MIGTGPRPKVNSKKALQLNPNSLEARHYHANFLMAMGRFTEAVPEIERAAALDPLSSQTSPVLEGSFSGLDDTTMLSAFPARH